MNLSIVIAKVIRSNEQYKYKLVGKGEKYLVTHRDNENAGDIVVEYLKPFVSDIRIESVALQNNSQVVGIDDEKQIYKAVVKQIVLNEEGIEKRLNQKIFLGGKDFFEANTLLMAYIDSSVQESEVLSISKTNIIELIDR